MKKISYLFLVLFSIFLYGCSDSSSSDISAGRPCSLSLEYLPFGDVNINDESSSVITKFECNQDITITSVGISGSCTEYSISPSLSNYNMVAGVPLNITVSSEYVTPGNKASAFVIYTSDGNRYDAALMGTAVGNAVGGDTVFQLSPSFVDYGIINTNSPTTKSITITNISSSERTMHSVESILSDLNTGEYINISNRDCAKSYQAGDSCTFDLTVQHSNAGTYTGKLHFIYFGGSVDISAKVVVK